MVRGSVLTRRQSPRPEAAGVIGASVYILLLSLFAPLPYITSLLPDSLLPPSAKSTLPILNTTTPLILPADDPCSALLLEGSLSFPHHSFATYLASLLSLLVATFLGFCDDVFDIRWRFKLPIPRASRLLDVLDPQPTDSPTPSHRLCSAPRDIRCGARRDGRRPAQVVWLARVARRSRDERGRPPG